MSKNIKSSSIAASVGTAVTVGSAATTASTVVGGSAAAPVAVVAAIGYGLFKLFED